MNVFDKNAHHSIVAKPVDTPVAGPPVVDPVDTPVVGPADTPVVGPAGTPVVGPVGTPVVGPMDTLAGKSGVDIEFDREVEAVIFQLTEKQRR